MTHAEDAKGSRMGLREDRCPICGKTFFSTSEWAYRKYMGKGRYQFVCSWSCCRKAEAMSGIRKKYARSLKRKHVEL